MSLYLVELINAFKEKAIKLIIENLHFYYFLKIYPVFIIVNFMIICLFCVVFYRLLNDILDLKFRPVFVKLLAF